MAQSSMIIASRTSALLAHWLSCARYVSYHVYVTTFS
jgi:hypothetical protein